MCLVSSSCLPHLINRAKYCQVPQDDPAGVVRCNPGWVVDPTKSLPILIVVANKFINATCQDRGYDPSSAQCSKHLAFNQAFFTQAQVWATSLSGNFWNNGDYWWALLQIACPDTHVCSCCRVNTPNPGPLWCPGDCMDPASQYPFWLGDAIFRALNFSTGDPNLPNPKFFASVKQEL